jgi:hypothetical protein
LPFPFAPCDLPGPDGLGEGDEATASGEGEGAGAGEDAGLLPPSDAAFPIAVGGFPSPPPASELPLPLFLACPPPLPLPFESLDVPEPLPLLVPLPLPVEPPPDVLEDALPPELVGRLGVGAGWGLPLLAAELEPWPALPALPEFEAGAGSLTEVAGAVAPTAGIGEATGWAGLPVVDGALGARGPRWERVEPGPAPGAVPATVGAADSVGVEPRPGVAVAVGARPNRLVPSSTRPDSEASLTMRGRPPLPPLEER